MFNINLRPHVDILNWNWTVCYSVILWPGVFPLIFYFFLQVKGRRHQIWNLLRLTVDNLTLTLKIQEIKCELWPNKIFATFFISVSSETAKSIEDCDKNWWGETIKSYSVEEIHQCWQDEGNLPGRHICLNKQSSKGFARVNTKVFPEDVHQ